MKNYVVKFETKEIIVTKNFLKQAEERNSEAYRELLALTKELPNFAIKTRVVCRAKRKSSYKGLTYNAMSDYLMRNDRENLETFEKLINEYNCSYFQVKQWFLRTCPCYQNMDLTNSYLEIAA